MLFSLCSLKLIEIAGKQVLPVCSISGNMFYLILLGGLLMTSNFCVLIKNLELDLLFVLLTDTCFCLVILIYLLLQHFMLC